MLTREIRSRIDAVWNAFWTGGISNPLEVIEQITLEPGFERLRDQVREIAGLLEEKHVNLIA
jgi:type I restriction enzyme M protein